MAVTSRRLFIALPVDGEKVAEALKGIYGEFDRYGRILKTVPQTNLHITMKFLGNADENRYQGLIEGFNSFEKVNCINFVLKGLGCFPYISSPSVIWGGIECDMKKISDLFLNVEELCSGLGFEKETRRFIPHLTLARVKRGRDVPGGLKDLITGSRDKVYAESVFDRLVLFESQLEKEGPQYFNRAEIKLL